MSMISALSHLLSQMISIRESLLILPPPAMVDFHHLCVVFLTLLSSLRFSSAVSEGMW